MFRINKVTELFEKNSLECCIITDLSNVRYLTGFTGSNALLLLMKERSFLFTDNRYVLQAKNEVMDPKLEIVADDKKVAFIIEKLNEHRIKLLGFEDLNLTFSRYTALKSMLPDKIKFIPLSDTVAKLRLRKDKTELKNIKRATEIAEKSFKELIKNVNVGISEKQLANKLEYLMAKNGSEDKAFKTIVASGIRSALPHGNASNKTIGVNEFIVFDFGASYNGYISDISRTIFCGSNITDKHKEIYNVVLEAQLRAVDAVKAGVKFSAVDEVARKYITSKGYGDHFIHGIGHGIGLEVHEQPNVNNEMLLEEDMVISIEPGIYIEGFGGVRIEDNIVVKKNGSEVLTKLDKKLINVV